MEQGKAKSSRFRQLIFLAHVWACLPFLFLYLYVPGYALERSTAVMGSLKGFAAVTLAYLLARTVLAWYDPRWLRWERVFPVIDALLVSVAVFLKGDPDSVLTILYFLPIAEAASTLDVRWAGGIGVFSVLGAVAATHGHPRPTNPFVADFRFFYLILMASLLAWLTRLAAEIRSDLQVAADRNRIAMEMHDGVQAELVAMAAQLEVVRCLALQDGPQTARIASEVRDLARRAADDLRFLVQRLRAPKPAAAFIPALQQYCHNLSTRSSLPIAVEVVGASYPLNPETEHALFRIMQESLNNALKHARATQAVVSIRYEPSGVVCIVRDDGCGFMVSEASEETGHFGLGSMKERAEQAGGTLQIESTLGGGTTVTATVPTSKRQ